MVIQKSLRKKCQLILTISFILVPTSFNSVTEEEWKELGVNIIIYANQLMRAQVPAIQEAARVNLENHRAEECDQMLIPENDLDPDAVYKGKLCNELGRLSEKIPG